MDRRRETRIRSNQTVQITVLGGAEMQLPARAVDFSGGGLKLVVECSLPSGSAIKIETEDSLLLGEICYSVPGPSGYLLGVEIQQVLTGLRELARLNSRLLGDWTPPVKPVSIEDQIAATRRDEHPELLEAVRRRF